MMLKKCLVACLMLGNPLQVYAQQSFHHCLENGKNKEDIFSKYSLVCKLKQLKTPSTVVIEAANVAAVTRSTNGGINYFYESDIADLIDAADSLKITVCSVLPERLSLPTPQGPTEGLSIDEALASCSIFAD